MCNKAVEAALCLLDNVSDSFVTQQQMKLWHDNAYYCNNDKRIEWCDGYKKQKAQKASIKDELLPIAWHPSRWWNWCIPKDEKRETENFFSII